MSVDKCINQELHLKPCCFERRVPQESVRLRRGEFGQPETGRRSLVCSQPATSQDRLSHSISYSISRMEPNFKEFICCLKWQQGNCWKYGNCHNKWISEVFMKYGITIEGCTKLPNNLITYNSHGRPNIILCKCRQEAIPEHMYIFHLILKPLLWVPSYTLAQESLLGPDLVAFSEDCHCVSDAVEAEKTPARDSARAPCSRFPVHESMDDWYSVFESMKSELV